jgi:hypothetical protein
VALAGAITQLALYGGIGLPYPPLDAPEPEPEPTPVVTPSGAHASGGGRWVQPTRHTLRAEDRRWREEPEFTPRARSKISAPKLESAPVRIVAERHPPSPTVAADPAEDELVLQAALVLLGLVE